MKDVVDFSRATIPIFFEEDTKWSDDIRKLLEKKLASNSSELSETCYNLLSKNKDFLYQHCNYEEFEKDFKKGLKKLIVKTFVSPYSRPLYSSEESEELPPILKKNGPKKVVLSSSSEEESEEEKHSHVFRNYSWGGYGLSNLQFVIHEKIGYVFNPRTGKLVGTSISCTSPLLSRTQENRIKFRKIVEKYNLFSKVSEEEEVSLSVTKYTRPLKGNLKYDLYWLHYGNVGYVFDFNTMKLVGISRTFDSKAKHFSRDNAIEFEKIKGEYVLMKPIY